MKETITSAEDFETIQGQPWYQYLSWQFPAMVGNVALEEWLNARVSDSRLISAVVKRCDAQSATLERLTAQQAESEQAHKAALDESRNDAAAGWNAAVRFKDERDALARQVEKLSKDKAKRHIIGTVLIDRSTGEVLDTPPEAITPTMKGETHE